MYIIGRDSVHISRREKEGTAPSLPLPTTHHPPPTTHIPPGASSCGADRQCLNLRCTTSFSCTRGIDLFGRFRKRSMNFRQLFIVRKMSLQIQFGATGLLSFCRTPLWPLPRQHSTRQRHNDCRTCP